QHAPRRSRLDETAYNVQEHARAGDQIDVRGVLTRAVADAAITRYEDHRGRTDARHHLRVVAGAGRHAADAQTELTRRLFDEPDHVRVERDRIEAHEALCRDAQAGLGGERREEVGQRGLGGEQAGVVAIAEVRGQDRAGGNDIDRVRLKAQLADRCHSEAV